jgi:hypothetical protein
LVREDGKLENAPAMGTPDWFFCIDQSQRAAAQDPVSRKVPVVVQHRNETGGWTWAVMFKDTSFCADAFFDQPDAEAFAKVWNDQCIPD